jgi:hypothetical protein
MRVRLCTRHIVDGVDGVGWCCYNERQVQRWCECENKQRQSNAAPLLAYVKGVALVRLFVDNE